MFTGILVALGLATALTSPAMPSIGTNVEVNDSTYWLGIGKPTETISHVAVWTGTVINDDLDGCIDTESDCNYISYRNVDCTKGDKVTTILLLGKAEDDVIYRDDVVTGRCTEEEWFSYCEPETETKVYDTWEYKYR